MRASLLLVTVAATAAATVARAQDAAEKPNILLIISDDTGYGDTGPYLWTLASVLKTGGCGTYCPLQSEGYSGLITLTEWQRFQNVHHQRVRDGFHTGLGGE